MIKGFGVNNQSRQTIRTPIRGQYKQGGHIFPWAIEGEGKGLFRWQAGKMEGFTPRGSTVETALREIRDALMFQDDLLRKYGRKLRGEHLAMLQRLKRWERMVVMGRLNVKMKRRSGKRVGEVYWVVEETP